MLESRVRSSSSLFGSGVLVVLSTAFLSESAGFLTHQLNLVLGTVLLGAFVMTSLSGRRLRSRDSHTWFCAAFLGVVLVSLRADPALRPIAVFLCVLAVDHLRTRSGDRRPDLRGLAKGVFAFGMILIFEKHSPLVWSVLQSFSLAYSKLAGALTGLRTPIGSSLSGFYPFLLYCCTTSAFLFAVARRRAAHLILLLVGFLVVNGAAIALSHPFADTVALLSGEAGPGVTGHDRALLSLPVLTLVLGLIPFYFATRAFAPRARPVPVAGQPWLAWVGLLGALASVLLLVWTSPAAQMAEAKVSFYKEGYLNWMRPVHGDYGSRSGGMFGNLPLLVEALGYESAIVDSVDPETLSGTRVLFMINTDHRLPDESYEYIRRFVEQGGSLIILGDHTFFKEEKTNWVNRILTPFDIRLNFDSANYFIGGWLHSYFYPASPLTAGLGDELNEVGSVVGASLSISYPAVPIVVGRFGFSDDGDPAYEEGGYIGDLEYERGERVGDVVLVAAQNYGRGKVLVFGDTSAFANSLMVDTHRFVNRVVTWAVGEGRVPSHGSRLWFSLPLLLCSLWLMGRSASSLARSALLAIAVVVLVTGAQIRMGTRVKGHIRGNFVLVDDSHLGRYPVEFWKPFGLMGLHLNMMRNGFLSFTMHEFDSSMLAESKALVLIGPTRPFGTSDIRILEEYVREGGNLLLCVGYEERAASLPVLRHFGFEIENIPLGTFLAEVPAGGVSVYFREAWPVSYSGTDGEVLAGRGEYATAVTRKLGDGRVIVLGDTSFFSNINLETETEPVMPNIVFLGWLLDHIDMTRNG